jgi:hypothetical protein
MTESTPLPVMSTFVVRFWQEWSAGKARWRGRIEHIPSGSSVAFLHADAMWAFVRSFGVAVDDTDQSRAVGR